MAPLLTPEEEDRFSPPAFPATGKTTTADVAVARRALPRPTLRGYVGRKRPSAAGCAGDESEVWGREKGAAGGGEEGAICRG